MPWSTYVRLLSVRNPEARRFYDGEALGGGWTVRQLDRQIGSQFYERTALSKNKAAMLRKGQGQTPDDVMTPEEAIKDPFFFEFLNLKDEYSESDLESALISKLETFLLEPGGDFMFVGRQRRLRVGDCSESNAIAQSARDPYLVIRIVGERDEVRAAIGIDIRDAAQLRGRRTEVGTRDLRSAKVPVV